MVGGIPVVLLVGDDYQLPPVITKGKGKGYFYIVEKTNFNIIRIKNENRI